MLQMLFNNTNIWMSARGCQLARHCSKHVKHTCGREAKTWARATNALGVTFSSEPKAARMTPGSPAPRSFKSTKRQDSDAGLAGKSKTSCQGVDMCSGIGQALQRDASYSKAPTCQELLQVRRQRPRRTHQQGSHILDMRRQGPRQLHPDVHPADRQQGAVAAGLPHMRVAPRGVDLAPAQQLSGQQSATP